MRRGRAAIVWRYGVIAFQMLNAIRQLVFIHPFRDEPGRRRLVQSISQQLLAAVGVELNADSLHFKHIESGLVVCNHISILDVLVINAVAPSRFVAKSDIAGWPLLGWMGTQVGTIFIRRRSFSALRTIRPRINGLLGTGQSVAVFPEGTTSNGESVLPFRPALFQCAIDTKVPLHSLALSYHLADGQPSQIPAYIDTMTLVQCLGQIVATEGLQARLLYIDSCADWDAHRRALALLAHQKISSGLETSVPLAQATFGQMVMLSAEGNARKERKCDSSEMTSAG